MLHDFRYGARRLLRSRGFTAAAVLILALGIGANTAVFTVINTVLLGELPVPNPERVVKVYTSDYSSGLYGGSSYPDFADYRDRAAALTDIAAYTTFAPMNLGTEGGAERVQGAVVTRNFFEILGLRPAHGRFFPPGDDTALGSSPVAVLSYELWQRSLGASPIAIGQQVTLNGSVFTVIGVAPRSFRGVSITDAPALWVPMSMIEQAMPRRAGSDILNQRGSRWLQMVGRLATGATLETAQAEIATLAEQLAQANPSTNLGTLQDPDRARPVSILPANVLAAGPVDDTLLSLVAQLLMAVVGIVLLITCANVANLLLARANTRHREIAVRQSLGASRGRLLRQLLAESTLLALLGGAAGLLLGVWAARLLPALVPGDAVAAGLQLPELAFDSRVLTFTAGLSLATGVLFGLAPALQTTRPNLIPALKDATGEGHVQRSRLRGTLVVAQVALSIVLLISAGLFVRSLQMALATNPGFNTRGVLLAALDLSLQGYDETRGLDFYARLMDRVGNLPGIEAVSVASVVPVSPSGSRTTVEVEGYASRPQEDMELNFNRVGPGYFRAMGIAVVRGRVFGESAIDSARGEVVVNETFAQRYWPGQNPIGRGIRFGRNADPDTVIGVVQNGKYRGMREDALPYMYRPLGTSYTPRVALLARTDGDPMAMLPAVRAELQMLDSTLPIYAERTLAEQVGSAVVGERLAAMLLGVFGAIALLLATVGIYGLVAHAVEQRTHEIGVRMALGADRRDVVRLVVGQGMGLVLVGVGLGLVGSVALTRAVASLLFGISPTDATTFALVPVGLMVVALLACLLPARRAARIDPMRALRYE
jgi:predicted permease